MELATFFSLTRKKYLSLSSNTALGVGNLDTQRLGLGQDIDTLARGDGVTDPVLISFGPNHAF